MDQDKLKTAVKLAGLKARNKLTSGAAPMFLGVEGQVALIYNQIVEYGRSKDITKILDIACDALLALVSTLPDVNEWEDEEDVRHIVEDPGEEPVIQVDSEQ